MLTLTLDYEKNRKDSVAYVAKKIEISSSSPLFRIEGSNGSGKTLILETIAYALWLNRKHIHDEWLGKFYSDLLRGNYEQKIAFKMEANFNNVKIYSEKNKESIMPRIMINGETVTPDDLELQFPIFFDSIKSPEKQAEEYLRDAKLLVDTIQTNIDLFSQFLAKLMSEHKNYEDRKNNLENYKKKLEDAINKAIINEEFIIKSNNYLKILECKKIQLEIEVYNKEILKYREKLIVYDNMKKEEAIEKKKEEKINKKISEAEKNYLEALKRLMTYPCNNEQALFIWDSDPNFKFIENMRNCNQIDEIYDYVGRLYELKRTLDNQIKKITSSEEYKINEFYNDFYEFIDKHFSIFFKFYPKIYEEVKEKGEKIRKTKEKINSDKEKIKLIDDLILNICQLYEATPDKTRKIGTSVTFNNQKVSDLDKKLFDIKRNIEYYEEQIRIKKIDLEKYIDILKSEEQNKELVKLPNNIAEIDEEIYRLKAEKESCKQELDKARNDKIKYKTLITEAESIKEPQFFNYKDEIKRIYNNVGHIISYLNIIKSVIDKLLTHDKKLDDEEIRLANKLGKYFATLQQQIFIDPVKSTEPIRIVQIDLINNAYVLEDSSVYPFQSNTGNILINTLIGKIRSLDPNKNNILLIDEVSPLDQRNIEILEKELSAQIKKGAVYLAAIAIPGNKYDDNLPHIKEVDLSGP
ncbi:MAG: hypothetical protein ABC585_05510 [Candidatus Methanosuratincola petrocarbonis]